MEEILRKRITDLVQASKTLTLATVREDGWPQATTVAYASSHFTLYVATGADSQKVRNIRHNPKVSLAIDNGSPDWAKLTGLSMAAVADVIDSPSERQQVARLLKRRFPDLAEYSDMEHDAGWAFLRLEPKVISLIDYAKGFGHSLLIKL